MGHGNHHLARTEEDEDLEAVRKAVSELETGEQGIPLDEAFDNVRKSHQASQDA